MQRLRHLIGLLKCFIHWWCNCRRVVSLPRRTVKHQGGETRLIHCCVPIIVFTSPGSQFRLRFTRLPYVGQLVCLDVAEGIYILYLTVIVVLEIVNRLWFIFVGHSDIMVLKDFEKLFWRQHSLFGHILLEQGPLGGFFRFVEVLAQLYSVSHFKSDKEKFNSIY